MSVMDIFIHGSFFVEKESACRWKLRIIFLEGMAIFMWVLVKEFFNAVMQGAGEEMSRAGSGAIIVFFCMIAFSCITIGIFLEGRCATLYYVTAEGKRKLLGSLFVQKGEGIYRVKSPVTFLEKSESIYYYMHLPKDFAHRHYMEEILVELPAGKKRLAIKKQMQFKNGLK